MEFLEGKKTYIGILIAAFPTVAGLIGYDITVEGAVELGGILGTLLGDIETTIGTFGLLIAAYGRRVTKS